MPSIKYKKKTYAGATFPVLEMTKAEYDALSEAKKMDGTVYMITDDTGGWEAENSAYDNTESGLTATNVQDALDEIVGNQSFKTLILGGINSDGTYTATTSADNISEVVFSFIYGSKVRQSVVLSIAQLTGGLGFPDIYLAGARAYMDVRMSGSTITVSSFTKDTILSNGYWGVMYK